MLRFFINTSRNILLSLIVFCFFIGCSNKSKAEITETPYISISLENVKSSEIIDFSTQKWHITNKVILVLFGYNFNSEETSQLLLSQLEKQYGLAEYGGLILPVFYPTSFKHTKSFYSELYNIINDSNYDLEGIITLGAPENTNIALSKNQDYWNDAVPYPVIALFPQDNIMATEAACDIVIDKAQNAHLSGELMAEDSESTVIKEAPQVIADIIDYISETEFTFSKDNSLQIHVKQILKGLPFRHYVDSETGLQAINHFVLN